MPSYQIEAGGKKWRIDADHDLNDDELKQHFQALSGGGLPEPPGEPDLSEALKKFQLGKGIGTDQAPAPGIIEGLGSVARQGLGILGTPARGLGMLVDEIKAGLTGQPSELRVHPDSDLLTGEGVETPGLGEMAMTGLEDIFGVVPTDVPGEAGRQVLQTTAERREERNKLLEGGGTLGRIGKVARGVGTVGLGATSDPSFVMLGPLAAAAKIAGPASKTAKVYEALSTGLRAGMAVENIAGVKQYIEVGKQHGFDSPEADNVAADLLPTIALTVGLEAQHRGQREPQLPEVPKVPTLEAAAEAEAGGKPVVEVRPEAEVPEGVSEPVSEGRELEQRFKGAKRETKALEKQQAADTRAQEATSFKSAQAEVRLLERAERENTRRQENGLEGEPEPGADDLRGPEGEGGGAEVGGGPEAGRAGARPGPGSGEPRAALPEVPEVPLEPGQAAPAEVNAGPSAEGQALLPGGEPSPSEAGGYTAPEGAEKIGEARRASLRPHMAAAVADAIDAFEKKGEAPASRAEILGELRRAGLREGKGDPLGERAATRIQLAADEVERYFGKRPLRGQEAAATSVAPGGATERPVNLVPPAPETPALPEVPEFDLSQNEPIVESRHHVPEEARSLIADAAESPAHQKLAEFGHRIVERLRPRLAEFVDPSKFEGFQSLFGYSGDSGEQYFGLTSGNRRVVGANLLKIAKAATERARTQGGSAAEWAKAETMATMVHELAHRMEEATHGGDTSSYKTVASEGRKAINPETGLPMEAPKPGTKLQKHALFDLFHAVFDDAVRMEKEGLKREGAGDLSDAEVADLARYHDAVDQATKNSWMRGEGLEKKTQLPMEDLAAQKTSLPPERAGWGGETGAAATDIGKQLLKAAGEHLKEKGVVGTLNELGEMGFKARQRGLAGAIMTVIGNNSNYILQEGTQTLGDAVYGINNDLHRNRRDIRLATASPAQFWQDFQEGFRRFQLGQDFESPRQSTLKRVEGMGHKIDPELNSRLWGMFAEGAADFSKRGNVGRTTVQKLTDAITGFAVATERAQTAHTLEVGLANVMKETGAKSLDQLVDRFNRGDARVQRAWYKAAHETLSQTFRAGPVNEKGKKNLGRAMTQVVGNMPGAVKFFASSLIGTPFFNMLINNAPRALVEAAPVLNKLSRKARYSGELADLESLETKGRLTGAQSARIQDLRKGVGTYSKEFTRSQQLLGPTMTALAAAYTLWRASDPEVASVEEEKTKKGTWQRSLRSGLGAALPYWLVGEYLARKFKGDPRFKPEHGRLPDLREIPESILQLRGGQETPLDIMEKFFEPSEVSKVKSSLDKWASDLTKSMVPGPIRELAEVTKGPKRPDLPQRGEVPGLSAAKRGVLSAIPGVEDETPSRIDTTTGEPAETRLRPTGRQRLVSPLETFLHRNAARMPERGLTPRQTGETTFDKDTFDFWKKGLGEEGRVFLPDGGGTSITQLLEDSSMDEQLKADLLSKALPKLVNESSDYAVRKALEAAKSTGQPPLIPEEMQTRLIRAREKEERLKKAGYGRRLGPRPEPAARGLRRGEKRELQETLPEVPD